jgi:hypothetical protein
MALFDDLEPVLESQERDLSNGLKINKTDWTTVEACGGGGSGGATGTSNGACRSVRTLMGMCSAALERSSSEGSSGILIR